MLVSLGTEELKQMIADGEAEVCCHFCSEKYRFDDQELTEILRGIETK